VHPNAEPDDVLLWAEAREYSAGEQKGKVAEGRQVNVIGL
jgi:hypothetical protein